MDRIGCSDFLPPHISASPPAPSTTSPPSSTSGSSGVTVFFFYLRRAKGSLFFIKIIELKFFRTSDYSGHMVYTFSCVNRQLRGDLWNDHLDKTPTTHPHLPGPDRHPGYELYTDCKTVRKLDQPYLDLGMEVDTPDDAMHYTEIHGLATLLLALETRAITLRRSWRPPGS